MPNDASADAGTSKAKPSRASLAGLKRLIGKSVGKQVLPVKATGPSCVGRPIWSPVGKAVGLMKQLRKYSQLAALNLRKRSVAPSDMEYLAECRAAVAAHGAVTAEQVRQDTAEVTADLAALVRADRRGW